MYGSTSSRGVEWLLEVGRRRRWLGLLVFALAAACAATVVLSLPDVYRAQVLVLVEQQRADTAPPGDLDARLQMITQEVLSRSRLLALVQAHGLYPALRPRASADALAARMRRDIRTEFKALAQPNGAGSTIGFTLSYRGRDPRTVATVANALAAFYVEQDARIRERQASGAVNVLNAQLEDMKRELERQEQALAQFQEQHVGELPQHADANLAALERLHADLRTIGEQKARALERRDDVLRRLADDDAGAGAGAPAAPSAVARARQELQALRQRFSDKHPDVIQKRAEVAELERADAAAPAAPAAASGAGARLREALADAEAQIQASRQDEDRTRDAIAGYTRRLENAPLQQRALAGISRDYQATRDLYDSVRKRYEQAQLDTAVSAQEAGPRFRVIDPAVVPTDPVAPNRMMLLLLALSGAAALAAAAMAAVERFDSSFHSVDELCAYTRVPVLATIPLIVTAADRRRRRLRGALATALALAVLATAVSAAHHVARDQDALVAVLARS
jgi:polysaccharide chain length determinant protein (PEP-CTERM system associated)